MLGWEHLLAFNLTLLAAIASPGPSLLFLVRTTMAEGRAAGSRNHMGVDDPAVDAMIDALVQSETRDDLVAAARALDRVLSAGRYVIPFWYAPASRIAHDARLAYPEETPLYGDWTGFLPDVWWRRPSE